MWRTTTKAEAGVYAVLTGAEGLKAFDTLSEDRASIDQEFADAGLRPVRWERTDKGGTIAISWPAALPWTPDAEDEQARRFQAAANQMVNSIRPRLQGSSFA